VADVAVWLLYAFTIVTTLAMLGGLPVVLLTLTLEYLLAKRHGRQLCVALLVTAGYLAGCMVGWNFRPFGWTMSFIDTLRAQTADHAIEYFAERVLLFVLMTGSVGAWTGGALGWLATKKHVGQLRCHRAGFARHEILVLVADPVTFSSDAPEKFERFLL
jgi:hypothetical protein